MTTFPSTNQTDTSPQTNATGQRTEAATERTSTQSVQMDETPAYTFHLPVEETQAELEAARAEIAKLKDDYLRALAESENTRRRSARDRQETSQYAIAGFARDLLSVVDNLRRALDSAESAKAASDASLESLFSGVEMTERELLAVLERHGVQRIEASGQLFDPHIHEAMFELPDDRVPQGTIVHVLQPGYQIYDRILRPAQVGVAKGGPKAAPLAGEAESASSSAANSSGEFTAPGSGETYARSEAPRDSATGSRVDQKL
jgi:molecular chaperone GrpE